MVTYGSYLQKSTKLTSSVSKSRAPRLVFPLLAGLMIVPATFAALGSGDAVAQNSGPSLMFIILPQVFENLGGAATIIGVVFFVLVLFAVLRARFRSLKPARSIISDGAGWSRKRSLIVTIVYVTLMGVLREPGLQLAVVHPTDGRGLEHPRFARLHLQLGDDAYRCASTCVFVGWIIKPQTLIDEVRVSARFRLANVWSVVIKYIAPVMLVVILVAYARSDHGSVQHVADQLPARLRGLLASFLFAYLAIGARRAGLFLFFEGGLCRNIAFISAESYCDI